MDHLKRFFLELASLGQVEALDLDLPEAEVFFPKKVTDTTPEAAESVKILETLWDNAVAVKHRETHRHSTVLSSAAELPITADTDRLTRAPIWDAFILASSVRQRIIATSILSIFFSIPEDGRSSSCIIAVFCIISQYSQKFQQYFLLNIFYTENISVSIPFLSVSQKFFLYVISSRKSPGDPAILKL